MFVQFRFVTCAKLRLRALIGKFQVTEPQKFYHENFHLKQNLLNLENWSPRNFPAIRYPFSALYETFNNVHTYKLFKY